MNPDFPTVTGHAPNPPRNPDYSISRLMQSRIRVFGIPYFLIHPSPENPIQRLP